MSNIYYQIYLYVKWDKKIPDSHFSFITGLCKTIHFNNNHHPRTSIIQFLSIVRAFQQMPFRHCDTRIDIYQHISEICILSLKCWYPPMKLDSITIWTPTVWTSSIIRIRTMLAKCNTMYETRSYVATRYEYECMYIWMLCRNILYHSCLSVCE